MHPFSWQHWIRDMQNLLAGRRARRPVSNRALQIEGLESRTLLTANLPVAVNDPSYTVNEDTQLNGTSVLANDTDADGDTIDRAILGADVQHGVLVLNQNGTFTYTPNSNYSGTDSFTYFARDATHNENSATAATVTITINPVNDAPTATATSINVNEDVPFNGALAGTDPEGNSLTFFAGALNPAHGSVVINGNGTFTYTPAANFQGTDQFNFFVNDGSANSAPAVVSVTVAPVNDAPVANAASAQTNEDIPLFGTLTGSDIDGNSLTFFPGAVTPQHGGVSINQNGGYIYTPAANYNGPDSFSFVANDGTTNSAPAIINITVLPQNDSPVANSGSITVTEDVAFGGALSGSDGDGDPLTFSAGPLAPAHGSVVVTSNGFFIYTPNANFNGVDSFTFRTNDGSSNSAPATVSITVTAVNDAPVATSASISTNVNTPLNGTLAGSDVDGNPLTFLAGSVAPAHGGVVIGTNGSFTYTPTAGYVGSDSFTFKVNDGTVNSADATVTVAVTAVNVAPVVTNGSAAVNENAVLNASVASLASDANGDPLTFAVVANPAHGTLVLNPNGTFTYTPATNYSGPDSFTFKANDGHVDSNVGTLSLTVVGVNSPLTVTLPSGTVHVPKTSTQVQLDPAGSVSDPDTTVNYGHAQIAVGIANLPSSDAVNNRISLSVRNQGSGTGLVKVKGSTIYYNGSAIATANTRGGTFGRPLVITFTSSATEQAVNAVLKQICIQASKRATSGTFTVGVQVIAGNQFAQATKNVVIS